MGTKYKMPTVSEFWAKKKVADPRPEPPWIYLNREMKANIDQKPYNETVGEWLKFLKDYKAHQCEQAKKVRKRLEIECGPAWYFELSSEQRKVLQELKFIIHQDIIEDLPDRTRKALNDLGCTLKLPRNILLNAMKNSDEDPAVFIWNLYTALYKRSPSELQSQYDMNQMLLMSSLVFIDLEETIKSLERLTKNDEKPPPPPKKKKKKNFKPDVRYGTYLEKSYVPYYSSSTPEDGPEPEKKPPPITYKFRLRSQDSTERLCREKGFLDKRRDRNKKAQEAERVCDYPFWEPPTTLRNKDPKMVAYIEKLKMLKKKPTMKCMSPSKNSQYHVGGVAFLGGQAHYVMQSLTIVSMGYIPINGGIVNPIPDVTTTNILGYWKYPKEVTEMCDVKCNCLAKWEKTVLDYLARSKCKCGHRYDFYNKGELQEQYFYPATRHGPYRMDYAKIFQMDPKEDFIKKTVADAMMSQDVTPVSSKPTIGASGLKPEALCGALLADLAHSPLVIPHLPQSNKLNHLKEWVEKRVHGKISPEKHKKHTLKSLRRWIELNHIPFRGLANQIPFTLKNLKHMTWQHREMMMQLYKILQKDYITRNQLKQLEQSRLWWATMKYDAYPAKPFLDIFFTYMPSRMKDSYMINPYDDFFNPKRGGKTCPLQ